jgi:hypothetical protein
LIFTRLRDQLRIKNSLTNYKQKYVPLFCPGKALVPSQASGCHEGCTCRTSSTTVTQANAQIFIPLNQGVLPSDFELSSTAHFSVSHGLHPLSFERSAHPSCHLSIQFRGVNGAAHYHITFSFLFEALSVDTWRQNCIKRRALQHRIQQPTGIIHRASKHS